MTLVKNTAATGDRGCL